jgi:hypothetical protein
MLYDRLWHNSALSPTTVGAQTVNSVALTRPDANGDAVEAWLEVYTTLGAGSTAKTLVYTNSGNTGSRTATLVGFVTTAAAGRCFPFTLTSGDLGVKSIQSFNNVATSTSGTFGLVLRRLVSSLFIPLSSTGNALDPIAGGLPRVYDDACLEFVWTGSSTLATTVGGALSLAQG